MGHIKPELIADLSTELAVVRELPLIKEKRPGVFYFKSVPFLHFHDKEGQRWAHLKEINGDWKRVDIPFQASLTQKKRMLKVIQATYEVATLKLNRSK